MVHRLITKEQKEKNKFKTPYLELFTAPTPNGYKNFALLELLGVDYYIYSVNIRKGESKQPWFLEINPVGKIPVLKDVLEDGESVIVSESAAILLYLSDKYDKEHKYTFTRGTREYYEMHKWIYFQVSELAPMKGQFIWFSHFTPEKNEMAIEKFHASTLDIYVALEKQLKKNGTGYLVGDKLSLADINTYPWIGGVFMLPETINYPNLLDWYNKLKDIPELNKCYEILKPNYKFPFSHHT